MALTYVYLLMVKLVQEKLSQWYELLAYFTFHNAFSASSNNPYETKSFLNRLAQMEQLKRIGGSIIER